MITIWLYYHTTIVYGNSKWEKNGKYNVMFIKMKNV